MKKTPNTTKQTLRIFWRFTRQYKGYFWIGTLGAVLGVIVQDILPPLIIAKAFDLLQHYVNTGAPLDLDAFLPYFIRVSRSVSWPGWLFGALRYGSSGSMRYELFINWPCTSLTIYRKMGNAFHSNRFGGALVSQTNKFLGCLRKNYG